MLFHESILFLFSKGKRAKNEHVHPDRGRLPGLFVFSVFEERRVQMSGQHRGPLSAAPCQTSSVSPPRSLKMALHRPRHLGP